MAAWTHSTPIVVRAGEFPNGIPAGGQEKTTPHIAFSCISLKLTFDTLCLTTLDMPLHTLLNNDFFPSCSVTLMSKHTFSRTKGKRCIKKNHDT